MRESNLTDGTPFIGIKVEHYVKRQDFAKHLAEHFDRKGEEFNSDLKKKEAMLILKNGLFFYGLYGEIEETLYEGSDSALDGYNAAYRAALDWVSNNYPYLIKEANK